MKVPREDIFVSLFFLLLVGGLSFVLIIIVLLILSYLFWKNNRIYIISQESYYTDGAFVFFKQIFILLRWGFIFYAQFFFLWSFQEFFSSE
jgi:hypothetical protein